MAQKIHFIGICGTGMSAVAILLKEMGWRVTGSDANFYPPVSTYLEQSEIRFFRGYRKENIPSDVEIIVIGKHAELTPELNEEVRAAFEMRAPIKSFAEVLGEVTQGRENIVVVGSYGKSTCAALLAWCLESAGKEPGYVIGAIPLTPNQSSAAGKGKQFIIEGDEYPAANWDNSSKFLHYHPSHLLLTALAHDHINIFKTVEDYRAPFKKLIAQLPADGLLVACSDGNGVRETLKSFDRETIFYSADNTASAWRGENITYGEITSFDLIGKGQNIIRLSTELLGKHNLENIVGVAALLLSREIITAPQLQEAILTFKPPQRRLNKLSDASVIPAYEGFGSSREKAMSAIDAIRLHYPTKKLVVLFEPHTFSWRTREALPWYDTVFAKADRVLIYKPPLHGSQPDQLELREIVDRVKAGGIDATGFESAVAGMDILEDTLDTQSVEIGRAHV